MGDADVFFHVISRRVSLGALPCLSPFLALAVICLFLLAVFKPFVLIRLQGYGGNVFIDLFVLEMSCLHHRSVFSNRAVGGFMDFALQG